MLLEYYWIGTSFVFGAIIGSFLNVVIYRLHTGKSLNGRSHCLSCQKTLHWYELFPVISFVCLRGRCGGCGSYIPVRYALVELLMGVGVMYLYLTMGSVWWLVFHILLFAILVVGVVYDLYHMIIPNEIPLALLGLHLVWLVTQHHQLSVTDGVMLPVVSGLVAGGFYAFLWVISKGRWLGLGDAKLAFPLGLLLSLNDVFSMIILSFWIGALVATLILLSQKVRDVYMMYRYTGSLVAKNTQYLTMKSEVPFAPFLVAAFGLVYFFSVDVLALTEYVIISLW